MTTRRRAITELFEGGYLLEGEVGGRPLQLPLLVGRDAALLLDTGCASDVENLILPSLEELGVDPAQLTWLINTHCDVDHQGGNAGMKKIAPAAILACGDSDRDRIDSPQGIYQLRYEAYRADHDVHYDEAATRWIFEELGDAQPVELTFRGGERLRLAPDWDLEVLHLPGHSDGHLGLLDHKHQSLFGGDAIQGAVYLSLEGIPALCPTYLNIPPYLATIRRIEEMAAAGLQIYCGCHWPVMRGDEIGKFCVESREFVERAEHLIVREISESQEGQTLRELSARLGPQLGSWPTHVHAELCYAFAGHLDDLESRGAIRRLPGGHPVRYVAATPSL